MSLCPEKFKIPGKWHGFRSWGLLLIIIEQVREEVLNDKCSQESIPEILVS
jgi:hypothetical protein